MSEASSDFQTATLHLSPEREARDTQADFKLITSWKREMFLMNSGGFQLEYIPGRYMVATSTSILIKTLMLYGVRKIQGIFTPFGVTSPPVPMLCPVLAHSLSKL